jgi:hypothetical protein
LKYRYRSSILPSFIFQVKSFVINYLMGLSMQ